MSINLINYFWLKLRSNKGFGGARRGRLKLLEVCSSRKSLIVRGTLFLLNTVTIVFPVSLKFEPA